MQDLFIYRLVTCFTTAVIVWALFAYTELWVNLNLKNTSRIIAELLKTTPDPKIIYPLGYSILEGTYKGRKIVCRLNSFTLSSLLRYDLRLHIHIEPTINMRYRPQDKTPPTQNTRISGNRIIYGYTSVTTVKSYFFSSKASKDEFIQIFEELTHAAEVVEANAQTA